MYGIILIIQQFGHGSHLKITAIHLIYYTGLESF